MSMPSPDELPLSPLRREERLLVVDVLRGFGLLGILLANLEVMSAPMFTRGFAPPAPGSAEAWVEQGLALLVNGKFLTLFSFLFGLGIFTQLTRARARVGRAAPFLLRRLGALLCIGLAHAILVWSGDVLVLYALLGGPLLLFRDAPPRWLLVFAVLVYLSPQLWYQQPRPRPVPARESVATLGRAATEIKDVTPQRAAAAFIAYRGSYARAVNQRLRELELLYRHIGGAAAAVFAMFLLGFWVAKKELLQEPGAHRPFLRRACAVTTALGLALSLAWLTSSEAPMQAPMKTPLVERLLHLAGGLGAPLLMFGYVTGLALLLLRERWRRWLAPLAPVGRMSLSNYLLQSLVGTTLFYGHGFGLYGTVRSVDLMLIGLALFVAQIILSRWWMDRFLFGPAEWVWRSIAYGRRQPMRRSACASVRA